MIAREFGLGSQNLWEGGGRHLGEGEGEGGGRGGKDDSLLDEPVIAQQGG